MQLTFRAAMVCLLGSALALAQGTDATVSGTITDPSGAHVADVKVSALHSETGAAVRTTTNQSGIYSFASLPPGTYRFSAEHPGFRTAVVSDIELEVGARLTINLPLDLGVTSETVEVRGASSELNTASSSVGDVISGQKLLALPVAGRSSYDLIATQPGVIQGAGTNGSFNMNGNRGGAVNFTTDGINSQDNLLPGSYYLYSNLMSVDRVEEFRVVTSPADAEYGRGAGQIQMITRSGSNAFHGSSWIETRNTSLNANDYFNNLNGTPRNVLHQNQTGVRLGGPVKRNRTFFNGIFEGQKQSQIIAVTQTVYTREARQGLFRFFPGVQNGNAISAAPTVDLQGNPVQPAAATGGLEIVSVLGRDPNRLVVDPSGNMAKQLALVPLPNNFRAGDGLNTAGFTWSRPIISPNSLYEGRVDHLFNEKHRISIVLTHQAYNSLNVAFPQAYPSVPGSPDPTETTQYSVALTSTLRPNLLNEIRIGAFRPRTTILTPQDAKPALLSTAAGVPYITAFAGITNPFSNSATGGASNRITPVYQYGDTMSWIRGRHAFKGGVEARFLSDAGFDAFGATPIATVGAGGVAVQNISTIPGIGQNAGTATNLLNDLSGSLSNAFQTYNSPAGANPIFLPGQTRYRNWLQREWSGFFKDDFKVTPSLTLNIGMRYEFYGVPTENQGKMLAPVGAGGAVFGVSGTSFASEFQPGAASGAPTRIQQIGEGTPNPKTQLYNPDRNNFAPAVGLAWSLPWLGHNKTVVRAGYGIGYERLPLYLVHNDSGLEPGLSELDAIVSASLLTVGNLVLPVKAAGAPLAPIPVTGTGSHTQNLFAFDQNLRTPYVQNYNFSIQRQLASNTWLTLSYAGSKGTKLVRSIDTNEVNVFSNGILQAFQTLQAGGTSPLMEQIFGAGGSNTVRTTSSTQGFLANNNVGGFANFIQTTTSLGAGTIGGMLSKAGLPANFVVANPQFVSTYLTGNFANSTYNSLQVVADRRISRGFTIQASYVFSKVLGEDEGDSPTEQSSYYTVRNMRLDKRRLIFDRTHVFKTNGYYELPFGHGKTFARNANGFVDRVIGGWQISGIFNKFSGQPLTFNAQNTFNNFAPSRGFTPNAVGALPAGGVTRLGDGVTYFAHVTQITDPAVASLTTMGNLRSLSTLKAIADASGAPIFVNPAAGQLGTLGQGVLTGPGTFRMDLNLVKRVRVTERVTLQLGATAQNLTNTEQFGNPNTNINSTGFGRITGSAPFSNAGVGTSSPARIVVLQGRITF
jgi:Outer membrane receptor for ferrienterochelin and colicins